MTPMPEGSAVTRHTSPSVWPSRARPLKPAGSIGSERSARTRSCADTRSSAPAMMRRACRSTGPSAAAKARITVRATSASSSVNPLLTLAHVLIGKPVTTFPGHAHLAPALRRRNRDDIDAAGEPIDANFIFGLFMRKPEHSARRRAVRIETDDSLPSRPDRVGAEQIHRNIAGDRNRVATLAHQNAAPAIERDVPLAAGKD